MRIQRFSVITLYQHYFPADGERSFGEDGEKLGKELGRNCWGGMGRWGESYGIESYRVESGTNKKESLEDFSSKLSK